MDKRPYTTLELRVIEAFRNDERLRDRKGWMTRCAFILGRTRGSIRGAANRMVRIGAWGKTNHYKSWAQHNAMLIEMKRAEYPEPTIAKLSGRTRASVSRQVRRLREQGRLS